MSKSLDSLTRQLHSSGSLKVWSLIITFFGDSIVGRGGNVSANTVQSVLEKMGIGAGAVRTAFSRLASDGWVERKKLGRRSYYQLTEAGVNPFAQAAQRIYSPVLLEPVHQSQWALGVAQDKAALQNLVIDDAYFLPNRSILLLNPDSQSVSLLRQRGILCVVGDCDEVPDWILEHLCPSDWAKQLKALRTTFRSVASNPPSDPLVALVVRTLLVHQWRRLLLRYPPLPPMLKGDSLALENQCREFVGQLYHQLSTPAECWLSEHGSAMNGDLPVSRLNPSERFTTRYLKAHAR